MRRVRDVDTFGDCTLDIGGLAIAIALDDSVGTEFRTALRHHFQTARLVDATPSRTIQVRCEPLPEELPGPILSSALGQDLRRVDGVTEVRADTTVARWDADGATLSLGPGCAAEETGYVIGMIALDYCSMEGIDGLHAALVVGARRTALVLGASGQGKSTTAGSALLVGLDVPSDDAVLVREHDGAIEGWGLPRTLAVPEEVGAGSGGPLDHRGRVSVEHDSTGRWHRIDEVLVVGHGTADETVLEPVAHSALLRELLTANLGSLHAGGERQRSIALFASLGKLPYRRLALGADAPRRPASTGSVLRELLEREHSDG